MSVTKYPSEMKKFTIEDIRKFGPCYDPEKYLTEDWSGSILNILDKKDVLFEDRLWVVLRTDFVSEKFMRLFSVWCARQVQHLMNDDSSIKALDVAEAFANGLASKVELAAARSAARSAAWDAAMDSARSAAMDAARSAAMDAQENKLREMILAGIKTGDVFLDDSQR